jgi:hypothetical protein
MMLVPKCSIFDGLLYKACFEKIDGGPKYISHFLSARKADLKKRFQHLVLVLVLVTVVVCTRVKKKGIQCEMLKVDTLHCEILNLL